jgi:hypothetical protein
MGEHIPFSVPAGSKVACEPSPLRTAFGIPEVAMRGSAAIGSIGVPGSDSQFKGFLPSAVCAAENRIAVI